MNNKWFVLLVVPLFAYACYESDGWEDREPFNHAVVIEERLPLMDEYADFYSEDKSYHNHLTSYLDITQILGKIWTFIEWDSKKERAVLNTVKYKQYMGSIISELKQAGMNSIDLAFAQFKDINALAEGRIDLVFPQGTDETSINEAFKLFIDTAHEQGFKISLSFGGESSGSYQICQEGETGTGQANKLASFIKNFKIDGADFDIENGGFSGTSKNTKDAQDFFKSLHEELLAEGKTSTLTVLGALSNAAPGGSNSALFYDENDRPIFNTMFAGINLMMYNAMTQYYIESSNTSWGIEPWIDIIGKENAFKLHIGFDDAIPYADQAAYAQPDAQHPYPFHIPFGTSHGKAGAMIFEQLQEKLTQDGYGPIVEPFWWPDLGSRPSTRNRYEPIRNPDGTYSCNFRTDAEMRDFNDCLKSIEKETFLQTQ